MNRKTIQHSLLILGLLSGCSGESQQGLDSQELTRVEDSGADGECRNGGVVVSSGSDANQNGKLDDDEIEGEPIVVCEGESRADPNNPELLTRVDALPVGNAECPAGGVALRSGLDDDDDTLLSDPEIDQTQLVCNHPVLTRAVAIPVGSPECIYGGQRIEAGADDGGSRGVAGDAVLDDTEVDTSYVSCNASPPVRGEPIDPPAAPAGAATIDLRGGSAVDGQAGAGGTLSGSLDRAPCVPAVTKLFTTGAADASFVAPTLSLDFGAVPFVPATNQTLEMYEGNNAPVAGQFYYSINNGLVRWTGTIDEVVTGLQIPAGVTLTLPVANATLNFARDVDIQGTLTLSAGARSLMLRARQIGASNTGVVDVSQTAATTAFSPSVRLTANSQMVFRGALLAQGAAPGVAGVFVNLLARGRLVLEGKIDASGADAPTGVGGVGGFVNVAAELAGLWSAAEIDVSGGTGAFGGGAGGTIQLGYDAAQGPLDLRNRGALNASGGAQTGTCNITQCLGGNGGSILLRSNLSNLSSTGELRADGGAGVAGAGLGGAIEAYVLGNSTALPDARLSVSGAVHAAGGAASVAGANAGAGGRFGVANCTGANSVAELLGYLGVQGQGGNATGTGVGGLGGTVVLQTFDEVSSPRRLYANVPLSLFGGTGASGGAGGTLLVDLSSEGNTVRSDLTGELPTLVLGGDHDLRGGNAAPASGIGGSAGIVRLITRGTLISSGSLTTNTGSGAATRGARSGGSIQLRSVLGRVSNRAALTANGGDTNVDPPGRGNVGGCILLEGQGLSNSAALSARGGAGTIGGEGGSISLVSHGALGENTGSFDVSGGAGTPAGDAGLAGFDTPGICL